MSIVEQPQENELSVRELDQSLVLAAEKGELVEVKRLIQIGADVKGRYFPSPGTRWGSPGIEVVKIHSYTHRATIRISHRFPYPDREEEYLARDFGWTALQAASAGAHLEVVRFLIESGAIINARPGSPRGRTALQWAAATKNPELVQLLLDHDAHVNAPPAGGGGGGAVVRAVECGCEKTVELLFRSGARIDVGPDESGGPTALQAASEQGNNHLVKYLLYHGAAGVEPSPNYDAFGLSVAAARGHLDTVKLLLESGAQINVMDKRYYRTPLQAAAEHGHIHIVEFLLEHNAQINADASEYGGRTALQAAVEQGHHDVVRLLVNRNARVDEPPARRRGRSALQAAAERGDSHMVDVLLASLGSDAVDEAGEYYGRTALQAASEHGHIEIIKALIAQRTNVNEPPARYGGRTALQAAVERGDIDVIKLLVHSGADANARGSIEDGITALEAAAAEGNLDVLVFLVSQGLKIRSEEAEGGGMALFKAAMSGHAHVVRFLLENGVEVNTDISWGYESHLSPLYGAIYGGNIDIVDSLLEAGAVIGQGAQTALHVAAARGHMNIARRLIESGTDISETGMHPRKTALYHAVQHGHRDMVQWLLENMANDHGEVTGRPVRDILLEAVDSGDESVVKMLVDKGGNKQSLFRLAVERGDLQLVKLLHGMEVAIDNSTVAHEHRITTEFPTALEEAASYGFEDVVGYLLEKGADVNATSVEGYGIQALQVAAGEGHLDVVKMLLAKNADINAPDSNGTTALGVAVKGGRLETVKFLLSKGLDINSLVSRRGKKTALHIALMYKHNELALFLLNSGAQARDLPIINGKNPLHRLCKDKHINLFGTLLERCTDEDINFKDFSRSTILHIALRGGHIKIFDRLLMDGRISFEIRDARGNTALQYAIQQDNIEAARRLLNQGAKTNGLTFEQLQGVAESDHTVPTGGTGSDQLSGLNEQGKDAKPYVLLSLKETGMYLKRTSGETFTLLGWINRRVVSVFFAGPEANFDNIDKSFVNPATFLPGRGFPNPTSAGSVIHWGWMAFTARHGFRREWFGQFQEGIPSHQDMKTHVIFAPFIRFDWHSIHAKAPDLQLANINTEGVEKHQGKGTMDKDDVNNVPGFSVKARSVEISWVMSNYNPFSHGSGVSRLLMSHHFRGSLKFEGQYIPDSGTEFILWLLGDVCYHWVGLLSKAKKHLIEIRDFQLAAGGGDPNVIKSLLGHSREWYKLRELLDEHVTQSCKVLRECKEREALFGEILPVTTTPQKEVKDEMNIIKNHEIPVSPPTTNPRDDNPTRFDPLGPKPGIITRRDTRTAAEKANKQQTTMSPPLQTPKEGRGHQAADIAALPQIIDLEKRVDKLKDLGDLLSHLDKETKEMIELEFNLVSIHEARQSIQEAKRSLKMSESMKRLSWITFIFLPLMFVTGLFGMNVDILESNPSWKWYPISAAPFMVFVMLAWLLSKCSPLTKSKRWYNTGGSTSLLRNRTGLLTRRLKREQDLEMGNDTKEHND